MKLALLAAIGLVTFGVAGGAAYLAGRSVGEREVSGEPAARHAQAKKTAHNAANTTTRGFDAWTLTCAAPNARQKRCALTMRIRDKRNNHTILVLSVIRNRSGKPVLAALIPPGVAVSPGISLSSESGLVVAKGNIVDCRPALCEAVIQLDEKIQTALATREKAMLEFVRSNGNTVKFTLPTKGFDAGFREWNVSYPVGAAVPAAEKDDAAKSRSGSTTRR